MQTQQDLVYEFIVVTLFLILNFPSVALLVKSHHYHCSVFKVHALTSISRKLNNVRRRGLTWKICMD